MFEGVGKTIKGVANALCWIGIFAFIILGIVLINNDFTIVGWVTLIVGPLCLWIGSLGFYAFGQLVENSDIQTALMQRTSKTVPVYMPAPQPIDKNMSASKSVNTTMPPSQPVNTTAPEKKSTVQEKAEPKVATTATAIILDPDHVRCEKCGTVQRSSRTNCWGCGATFIRDTASKE